MKHIQIFDPASCCSSGCGADVDQSVVTFSADIDWAKQQGANIERFNLSQQAIEFTNNATVKGILENGGQEALPVLLVDGQLVLAGRYPSRSDLARWLEIPINDAPKGHCCSSCC